MTDSDAPEQTGLELIALSRDEPEASENRNATVQEKYIAQLLQQMAAMQTEIERLQNLTNLSISANTPLPEQGTNAIAPQTFSSPELPFPQNLPENSPLNKTDPHHTNPQASPQQSPLQNDPATPHTQINALIQNTPSTQNHSADQHILMAHIADHSKQYVPPIYVMEAQPFTTATPNMTLQEIGQCEEMDRRERIRTDESVAKEIYSLKEAFKNIQTSKGHEGLEYEDLCMHPDIELPVGYKVPKFGLFDGKGNPHAHLRSYCDKLIGVGILQPIPGNVPNPVPKWHDETKHCAYHSGIPGHDTENCYALRNKIETLIKEGVIQLKGPSSNVNNNSLPDHDDANVNMITVDEDHNLEGTIVPVQRKEKVESSTFITPMITVQVKAPFGVEALPPKSRVMASSFLGKVLSTNLRRKEDASLPKPVPPLSQSFVKACATQESKEDNAANLVKGFKRFFIAEKEAKSNMILGDYARDSTSWDAEQGDVLGKLDMCPGLVSPRN
ncbi:hypothetical protein K7X08_001192 [Anisodus acutangulus]|uniref:Gag-pro-like protein n=1 Tax=Anisodus acutangulus TaxID=402998 RepID=A0A9Q1MNA5_9SOLA|nr:hypothetical protein K7X08_001192 [Anisodus acutangulus]